MPGQGAYPLNTTWNVIDRLHTETWFSDADTAEKTIWETWIFGATSSGGTEVLAANVTALSTVAGSLTIGVTFASVVSALSAVTGNLTHVPGVVVETLQAVVTALSTVTGGLTIGVSFASAVTAVSIATGNLTKNKFFGAIVSAVSTVVGNLTVNKFFAAVVSAVSTVTGNLTIFGAAVFDRAYRVYKKIQGVRRWR